MKNVTLSLDEEILRRVRHQAVDHSLSLSAWVAELLKRTVADEDRFMKARPRALKRLERGFRLGGKPLTREEAHAR